MNHENALRLLGLHSDAESTVIEAAVVMRCDELESRRDSAPTDALREKYELELERVREAGRVLLERPSVPGLSQTQFADLPGAAPSYTIGDAGSDQAGSRLTIAEGQVLAGRYEIRERIGAGGMGAVFRAYDRNRAEEIAIKVLLPGLLERGSAKERFLGEARLSSALSHPGIVNVFDVQNDGELFFLTMELLEGRTLREEMQEYEASRKPFPVPRAIEIVQALCEALAYAHETTVHRDVKPENVFLTADGKIKLMDFGIARVMSASQLTMTGASMGTAYYMAPEQLKGAKEVDSRSDQYSVGIMLFELLTGSLPTGRAKPVCEQRKDVSLGLSRLIDRALAPDPGARLGSIQKMGQALQTGKVRQKKKGGSGKQTALVGGALIIASAALLVVYREDATAMYREFTYDQDIVTEARDRYESAVTEWTTLEREFPAAVDGFELPSAAEAKAAELAHDSSAAARAWRSASKELQALLIDAKSNRREMEASFEELKEEADELSKRWRKISEDTPLAVSEIEAPDEDRFRELKMQAGSEEDSERLRSYLSDLNGCITVANKRLAEDSAKLQLAVPLQSTIEILKGDCEKESREVKNWSKDLDDQIGDAKGLKKRSLEAKRMVFSEEIAPLLDWLFSSSATAVDIRVLYDSEIQNLRSAKAGIVKVDEILDRLERVEAFYRTQLAALRGVDELADSLVRFDKERKEAEKEFEKLTVYLPSLKEGPDLKPIIEERDKAYEDVAEGKFNDAISRLRHATGRFKDVSASIHGINAAISSTGSVRKVAGEAYGLKASDLQTQADKKTIGLLGEGDFSAAKEEASSWRKQVQDFKATLNKALKDLDDLNGLGSYLGGAPGSSVSIIQEEVLSTVRLFLLAQASDSRAAALGQLEALQEQLRSKYTYADGKRGKADAKRRAAAVSLVREPARKTTSLGSPIQTISCPAGSYIMGSPSDEEGRVTAWESQVRVEITHAFGIGVTEVTQGQWSEVMGTWPWRDETTFTDQKEGRDYPVNGVDLNAAKEFCRRLTARERKVGLPGELEYRLPDYEEWEYACRAGTKTAYSFGNNPRSLGDYAYFGVDQFEVGNNNRWPLRVASKEPNPWGLYDMHGNLAEWTTGKRPGAVYAQAIRGGSWRNESPDRCRSASIDGMDDDVAGHWIGFRVVLARAQE